MIVAAGDVHVPATRSVEWLAERADGRPVVLVPGNHEWFSERRDHTVEEERARALARAAQLGVHLLMDDEVVIGGVRFLGATLWTDFALYGDPEGSARIAERYMNDHRMIIEGPDRAPLRARTTLAWHRASRRWLEERLAVRHDPTVVVTHHVPHSASIAPRYAADPLNPAFCSDLSHLVEHGGATLWVHGHTHTGFDYRAGGTRVICNPKGYGPRKASGPIENPAFDERLVIEITPTDPS